MKLRATIFLNKNQKRKFVQKTNNAFFFKVDRKCIKNKGNCQLRKRDVRYLLIVMYYEIYHDGKRLSSPHECDKELQWSRILQQI